MKRARLVCLDLDTFFVSVERLLDPSLVGKPVVVGGQPGERGVVSACSYEVRAYGVRSGMSLRDAGRLAPDAIYLPTRHDTYGKYAEDVRAIAADYSPEIQIASIDEMYMSFSGCERLYQRDPDEPGDVTIERVVREMTAAIRAETGLPSSAGIAATRAMAKVASGLAKPAGVLFVPVGREAEVLAPLAVRKLPGVGPVAERKLAQLGVSTVGDLASVPVARLAPVFGAWAETMKRLAQGDGATELGPERPAFREHDMEGESVGSISNERTFEEDVSNPETVASMLCALSERVAWRARKRGVKARTVTLKLRYADFTTVSRGRTLARPTDVEREVHDVVRALYAELRDPHPAVRERRRGYGRGRTRIRLLGVQLSNLELARQLDLLPEDDRLKDTIDGIRERFGYDAVRLARGSRQKR